LLIITIIIIITNLPRILAQFCQSKMTIEQLTSFSAKTSRLPVMLSALSSRADVRTPAVSNSRLCSCSADNVCVSVCVAHLDRHRACRFTASTFSPPHRAREQHACKSARTPSKYISTFRRPSPVHTCSWHTTNELCRHETDDRWRLPQFNTTLSVSRRQWKGTAIRV